MPTDQLSPAAAARLAAITARARAAAEPTRHQPLPAASALPADTPLSDTPCTGCGAPAAVLLHRATWGAEGRPACPRCVGQQRAASTYTAEAFVTRPLPTEVTA